MPSYSTITVLGALLALLDTSVALAPSCSEGTFLSGGQCMNITTCNTAGRPQEFEAEPPTSTSDRVCRRCSTGPCDMDEFEAVACSDSADRVCQTFRPDIDCQLGSFSEFSTCTVTCGGGQRFRTRDVVVNSQANGEPCPAPNSTEYIDVQACNTQDCPPDCSETEQLIGGVCVEVDSCAAEPCSMGSCANSFECSCPAGFEGIDCSVDIDDCASSPCANGGMCTDLPNDFSCNCDLTDFVGELCDCPIGNCTRETVSCTEEEGRVCTECPAGLTGNKCDDECDLGNCVDNSVTCGQDGSNRQCSACQPGFFGTDCTQSCMAGRCDPRGVSCDQDTGSNVTCTGCLPGFFGSTCQQTCTQGNCIGNVTCDQDTGGDRECSACDAGFEGTDCSVDIDDCVSNPCANQASCVDEVNGFSCQCLEGFNGNLCENNIDECSLQPCQNGATCLDGIAERTCVCDFGFEGDSCEVDLCTPEQCDENDNLCVAFDGNASVAEANQDRCGVFVSCAEMGGLLQCCFSNCIKSQAISLSADNREVITSLTTSTVLSEDPADVLQGTSYPRNSFSIQIAFKRSSMSNTLVHFGNTSSTSLSIDQISSSSQLQLLLDSGITATFPFSLTSAVDAWTILGIAVNATTVAIQELDLAVQQSVLAANAVFERTGSDITIGGDAQGSEVFNGDIYNPTARWLLGSAELQAPVLDILAMSDTSVGTGNVTLAADESVTSTDFVGTRSRISYVLRYSLTDRDVDTVLLLTKNETTGVNLEVNVLPKSNLFVLLYRIGSMRFTLFVSFPEAGLAGDHTILIGIDGSDVHVVLDGTPHDRTLEGQFSDEPGAYILGSGQDDLNRAFVGTVSVAQVHLGTFLTELPVGC